MRLQAFLARAGAAPSRRKAEGAILAGRVTVNGETATLGARVTPADEIELDGHPVRLPEAYVYLALNKPAGYLTTMNDDRGRPTVAHLMPEVTGLVPAAASTRRPRACSFSQTTAALPTASPTLRRRSKNNTASPWKTPCPRKPSNH